MVSCVATRLTKANQTLGESLVNVDYAPHLHFQLIRDMEGNLGDYPGVSSKRKLEFYIDNCPNPDLLLKIF